MISRILLVDANVVYQSFLRDVMLRVFQKIAIKPRFTNKIHEEWMKNVEEKQEIPWENLEKTMNKINDSFSDSIIDGYEYLEEQLMEINPKDRHLLAAAIHGNCDYIISLDASFRKEVEQSTYEIETITPNEFLLQELQFNEDKILLVIQEHRKILKRPEISEEEYRKHLKMAGLLSLVNML